MDAERYAGVLLVRVWGETPSPSELRYRIVVAEPSDPGQLRFTGAGTINLLAAVEHWLETLTADPPTDRVDG